MQTKDSSFSATFRYNGEELSLIKTWTGLEHPHLAVNFFIDIAIKNGRNPQEMLKDLINGQLDKEALER